LARFRRIFRQTALSDPCPIGYRSRLSAAGIDDWDNEAGDRDARRSCMKPRYTDDNPAAICGWDDDDGARPSDAASTPDQGLPTTDRRQSEQQRTDASHDSDTRGEHRYDDTKQTTAEQEARQDRDDLKRRLGSGTTRRQR
jgi:hypothetical protein